MTAFIIWCIFYGLFIIIGIRCLFAKKPVGFWANSEVPEIKDVKKYNRAMCILWVSFGVIMILLGLPLLAGQNSPWCLITLFGALFAAIILMVIYVLVIEKKYKK